MKLHLKEKNAFVCGASQGIGKAIAERFAKMGANVIIAARNEENLKRVVNELNSKKELQHSYISIDFEDAIAVEESAQKILSEYETIHILVNNSGGPSPEKAIDADINEYQNAFKSHLIASQILAKAFVPSMKRIDYGRIINVISVGAKQPIENLGVSNAIRGAMASWGKTLSRELAPFGITVNNLLPGHTLTERLKSILENKAAEQNISSEKAAEQIKSAIPANRFAKPEELAYAAGFLASEKASFINGINLPVDGGFLKSL